MIGNKTKTYLEVIRALWELIDRKYDKGGWLPPGRQMAEEMGISHATYRKALKFIENESGVISCPPKGHYVKPKRMRVKKIGVISTSGMESPFLHEGLFLAEAIKYFYENGYFTHLIQAATVNQLYDNALIHAPRGLIWINPPLQAVDIVKKMNTEKKIPLIVIQTGGSEFSFCDGFTSYNAAERAKKRVVYLLERGHKRIGYIGPFKIMKKTGCIDVCEKYGVEFTPEYCIENFSGAPEKVVDLVTKKNVTGIISEGGNILIDQLFAALDSLPEKQQPEVMIPKFEEYCFIKDPYPKIKLIGTRNIQCKQNLGLEAAKMLIAYLVENKPLEKLFIS